MSTISSVSNADHSYPLSDAQEVVTGDPIPTTSENPVPSEAETHETWERDCKNTAAKINETISSFLEQQFNKATLPVDGDTSWPLKTLWKNAKACWKKETPSPEPFLEQRTEIQQAIADTKPHATAWFQKTLEEIRETNEKIERNTINKEEFIRFYQKYQIVQQLINLPLPNKEIPINYAVKINNAECLKLLLEMGASPLQKTEKGMVLSKDLYGQTIFDYATLNNNPQIKAIIIDFFKQISTEWFNTLIKKAKEENLPCDATLLEFAERSIYQRMSVLLEETSKKIMVADPLSPSYMQWLQFSMAAALAATSGLSKLLDSHKMTANGFLADHTANMTQVVLTLGTCLQMWDLSSSFVQFINGFMKSRVQVLPQLTYIGLLKLASFYTPFARLTTTINTAVVGSSIIDTAYLCYKNYKQRPLASAIRAVVTSVNLGVRYANIFDAFKPPAASCPVASCEEMTSQRELSTSMENAIKSSLIENANITTSSLENSIDSETLLTKVKALTLDLTNPSTYQICKNAYIELTTIFNTDHMKSKGINSNLTGLLTSIMAMINVAKEKCPKENK